MKSENTSWLRHALRLAILVCAASVIKWCVNIAFENPLNTDNPTYSISESKAKGIFVTTVDASSDFLATATQHRIKAAWIERKVKTSYQFIWFTKSDILSGYYFCVILEDGDSFILSYISKNLSEEFTIFKRRGQNTVFFVTLEPNALAEGSAQLQFRSKAKVISDRYVSVHW